MVTLEENRWGLKGSNSAFSQRGGGNAIISARPVRRELGPSLAWGWQLFAPTSDPTVPT